MTTPPQKSEIEQTQIAISGVVGAATYLSPAYGELPTVAAALVHDDSPQAAIEQRLSHHLAVLDALTYDLLAKSKVQADPENSIAYVETALRAQDAARKTALALHQMRSPKSPNVYVQQYIEKQLNQLVEGRRNEQALDTGAARITAAENPAMETLGAIDGSQNSGGQSRCALNFHKGANNPELAEAQRIIAEFAAERSNLLSSLEQRYVRSDRP